MKTSIQEHLLEFQLSLALARARYLGPPSRHLHKSSSQDGSHESSIKKYNGKNWILNRLNKNGRKTNVIIHALREHGKIRTEISERVKGKLSLGARILRVGGLRKIYKKCI